MCLDLDLDTFLQLYTGWIQEKGVYRLGMQKKASTTCIITKRVPQNGTSEVRDHHLHLYLPPATGVHPQKQKTIIRNPLDQKILRVPGTKKIRLP